MRGGKGDWDFPAIGEGHVDFGARARASSRGAGYDGPYAVEIEFTRRAVAAARRGHGRDARARARRSPARAVVTGVALLGAGFMGPHARGAPTPRWATGRRCAVVCARSSRGRASRPSVSARRSTDRLGGGARRAPASTRSTSACRRRCTARSPSARSRPASTCCWRSRSRSRSRTPTRSGRPPRRATRLLMVGHVLRFLPEIVELRRVRRDRRARAAAGGDRARGSRRRPTGTTGCSTPTARAARSST